MLRSSFGSGESHIWDSCIRNAAVLVAIVLGITLSACGGGAPGSPSDEHVQEPVVRNFSPFMSPIDFSQGAGQQFPTYTDSALTISTDPNYPGKIVIYFNNDTELDPNSIFIAGNPFLGVDPSVLLFTHEIPGVGNAKVDIDARVEGNRIILQPLPGLNGEYATPDGSGGYNTNLPEGQFTVGIFKNLKNSAGKDLRDAPVFHTFFVGTLDTVRPTVINKSPGDGELGVGASVPPPAAPPGLPPSAYVNVTGSIFGDVSPDIVVRFSEPISATSVSSNNMIVDFTAQGIGTVTIAPAFGYPILKSSLQQATLPSNGHELVFRPDYSNGGYPFGRQIRVRVLGLFDLDPDTGLPTNPNYPDETQADNSSPIKDLSGNSLLHTEEWTFQTIAPPDLPENPYPEDQVWFSATDRVGVIDTINYPDFIRASNGTPFPQGIPRNVLPQFTDTIATDVTIPNFDPKEINVDRRIGSNCHSYAYVQSENTGQIVIVNTRDSIPVALINTPTPGGLTVYNGAVNSLIVTNSSANTISLFEIGALNVGQQFLSGAIYVNRVIPTGNSPSSITVTAGGSLRRDRLQSGPATPIIMWIDRLDGTVNTANFTSEGAIKTFTFGADTPPNDVSWTPCFGPPAIPPIMYAAISQSGPILEGKVAFYIAGPGCSTGAQTVNRPDAIVGDLGGFDSPAGLDNIWPNFNTPAYFLVAESGSLGNRVTSIQPGLSGSLPEVLVQYNNVGANPSTVAHVPGVPFGITVPNPPPGCIYDGFIMPLPPGTFTPAFTNNHNDIYVGATGGGVVTQGNITTGFSPAFQWSPIPISGLRGIYTTSSQ